MKVSSENKMFWALQWCILLPWCWCGKPCILAFYNSILFHPSSWSPPVREGLFHSFFLWRGPFPDINLASHDVFGSEGKEWQVSHTRTSCGRYLKWERRIEFRSFSEFRWKILILSEKKRSFSKLLGFSEIGEKSLIFGNFVCLPNQTCWLPLTLCPYYRLTPMQRNAFSTKSPLVLSWDWCSRSPKGAFLISMSGSRDQTAGTVMQESL